MKQLYAEILFPRKIFDQQTTLTYSIPKDAEIRTGLMAEVNLRGKTTRGLIWKIHDQEPKFKTKPLEKILHGSISLSPTQLKLLEFISEYYFCPAYKALKLFFPAIFFSRKKGLTLEPLESVRQTAPLKELFPLTEDQKKALEQINNSAKNTILLHGITGSGKTEIYRRLTLPLVENGQQVLILVPEISLTPQTVQNFQKQFGKNIAIIHSRLTPKKKLDYLAGIYQQKYQIVIGSRSAIFSPFQKLGLIIIDEEHEDSYKQDQAPRYHARDLAEKILQLENNPHLKLILGSATPSIETFFQAEQKNYQLVELPKRLPIEEKAHPLPTIHLIDLREELKKKNLSIFSELLQVKMTERLQKKEQIIIFLNRRGAASALLCRDCGHTETCPDCEVSLTYHNRLNIEGSYLPAERLICHQCGKIYRLPTNCSNCQGTRIKYIGLGTQKIEEELQKLFPAAKILRADRDTTKTQDDFENLYQTFRDSQADILIGTQMIGKGLHLPNVTLVGIVLADTSLTIPDFRSAEKTFQLLTQVSGRSGRSKPGEVVIQTYSPENYAIQNTLKQDFHNFYQTEIQERQHHGLPPFQKLIKLTIEDEDKEKAFLISHQLHQDLEKFLEQDQQQNVSSINVYPALIPRLKKKFRWQILISGTNPRKFFQQFCLAKPFKNDIKIDVDPLNTI
ncbi:primosomal protein N' [Candidatus Peregrinibacteria bacterium]|nr:primosomal protein N' [Candidatus Peregrinibacteria bacterium]